MTIFECLRGKGRKEGIGNKSSDVKIRDGVICAEEGEREGKNLWH